MRWTGLRATGGGAFLDEELAVVEVERRRSGAVEWERGYIGFGSRGP